LFFNINNQEKNATAWGASGTVRLPYGVTACRGGREQDTCALRLPAHSFFDSKK